MVLGGGPLGSDWVMKAEPAMMKLVSLLKESPESLLKESPTPSLLHGRPGEDVWEPGSGSSPEREHAPALIWTSNPQNGDKEMSVDSDTLSVALLF